jgi:UTP--glucose-1-phosphate uridylyltransferase
MPATRAVPKEMLTVVDRPVIEYVVAEAQEAGIERFVFVIGPGKRAIKDHFSPGRALQARLRQKGLTSPIAAISGGLPPRSAVTFALQPTPLGLGHAVLCARDLVGDEPFAVLLPDVLSRGKPGCLSQIMETYEIVGGNVISVVECHPDETSRYGIANPGEPISESALAIRGIVEKPPPGTAPSNLRVNGRFILQPEIFDLLEKQSPGLGGEIQLSDAVSSLTGEQPLTGHRFRGRAFDCGSKEGFVAATIACAAEDPYLASVIDNEMHLRRGK